MKTKYVLLPAFILFCLFVDAQFTVAKPATNNVTELKTIAPKAVAFRLSPYSGYVSLPANNSSPEGTLLNLTIKEFDLGGNISGNSFIAPENGVYHFDIRLNFSFPIADFESYLRFYLMLNKNGAVLEKTILMNPHSDKSPMHTMAISTTIMLNKGDVITGSYNADANSSDISVTATEVSFSGFKVSGMDGVAGSTGTFR